MKLGRKIILGLVIALGALAALALADHYRVKSAVETYRRQLLAQGEKLTLAGLVPPPLPAESNNAVEFSVAAGRLRTIPTRYFPPAMKTLAPGRVLLSCLESNLPVEESSNIWPDLKLQFQSNSVDLAAVRAALIRPALQFDMDYHLNSSTRSPLHALITSGFALRAATVLELHEVRATEAWENLQALVTLARLYRGEPLLGSQRIRAAIAQTAVAATWEALQVGGWSEPQLAGLQQAWESFDLLDGLEPPLAMSRARDAELFDFARGSFSNYCNFIGTDISRSAGHSPVDDLADAIISPKGIFHTYMDRQPRYWLWANWWSYQEELARLQMQQAAIEAAQAVKNRNASATIFNQLDQTIADLQKLGPNRGHLLFADLAAGGDFAVHLKRMALAELQRRVVVAAIALQRHRLQHGKYPGKLAELTPDFLRQPPVDLMDGQPLRYQLRPDGGFLLYSVGEDGRDDGGDATSEKPGSTEWYQGRDIVWPAPATLEQVQAYKDKTLADARRRRGRYGSPANSAASSNAVPAPKLAPPSSPNTN